ncbi:hypothetical protein, partial [Paractinoplanes deccanensis]|uniref:hypothetical protein n=1 Tax=Paractinoplanes deccanensis TaxID=113561 RepID=UPI0019409570
MTPARSLAASVVALGFTGALSAPQPAFAAPAPCERAESYAAQSGAELLRINKLAMRVPEVRYKKSRPATESAGATNGVLGTVEDPLPSPEDSDTLSEGIGMLGTAVLGPLSPQPKAAPGTDGEADVVPPADGVTGRLGDAAERSGDLVGGLAGGSGARSSGSGGSGSGSSGSGGSGSGSSGSGGSGSGSSGSG